MTCTFPDEEMGISLRQTRGRAGRQVHDQAYFLKGWAAMIRKVYEVDPTVCSKYDDKMKIIAFLTYYAVVVFRI
jgi:hypothetical protein